MVAVTQVKEPKMRRLVAKGAASSDAVVEESALIDGPRTRLDHWHSLEASKRGMSVELWKVLRQPEVTDVVISGCRAWADRGSGLVPLDLGLRSDHDTRRLAIQMAAAASRRLDDAQPIVDGVLPGPVRLHAVLPPLAQNGTSISLRVLRPQPFTIEELIDREALTPQVAEVLTAAVNEEASVLISGATGVGKTTLLATLLGLVPPHSRIVAIEEVTELAINHPHVVSLQSRPPNIEGEGGIGLEELVRAAVRMRPDRLVLGECRGAELREVLTALNTGHRGGMATIHANSIEDLPARLLALGMLAGMDGRAVAMMAASAFEMVIHLRRDAKGRRYIQAIGDLTMEGGALRGKTMISARRLADAA